MSQKGRQQQKTRLFGLVALGVFGLSAGLAIAGLGNSVSEIREAEIAKSPNALLAAAGASENHSVALPVTYFDQVADECVDLYDKTARAALKERQFEWSSCGYYSKQLEQGLVEEQLDAEGLPAAVPGRLTPNQGLDFAGWFEEGEEGGKVSEGTLQLKYEADTAKFSFVAEDFYPLDDVEYSAGDEVNQDGHNHLWTMSFAVPWTVRASGDETFSVTADDDTFVFVNEQLALDMGGVHRAMTGKLTVSDEGKVYASVNGEDWQMTDITLGAGELAKIWVFHADRDSDESVMAVETVGMNLALMNGTQIAAVETLNSNDPTYMAPLGENKVFEADATRELVIIATVEGAMVLVAALLAVAVARFMVKQEVMHKNK